VAREFRLPDIGEGLTEAEIVRWLVAEGDEVAADQPIVEVETDKAVVEIPSPYDGVILSHGGAEGDVIAVGDVLVTIGEPGEALAPSPAPEETGGQVSDSQPEPIVGTLGEEAELLTVSRDESAPMPRAVQALPIVRKLARDHGIDLETVTGTGPGGRITRADVEAAIAESGPKEEEVTAEAEIVVEPEPEVAEPEIVVEPEPEVAEEPEVVIEPEAEPTPAEPEVQAEPVPTVSPTGTAEPRTTGDERRPLTRLRRTIAANMARSWSEIPHVTTFEDADATRLLEVRSALGDRHGMKVPIEALVIKAVLPAIDEFPEFNAELDGDDLILHGARDVGIAVDTPDGLLVAVIRDAASCSVLELAREVRRLGEGAKERTLTPDELMGQTFTVSNIGAVGGGHGTPIVPPGTTAILSVGAARLKPVVYDDDLAIAPVMPLSLSYDHRVIDGAVGRRFMALVLENIEEPALFLAV
jgi:pyruvate dehydrogenase E2 component (dihydrolipoamide acetyltransferase)